jgi:hypothetical protein
MIPQAGRWVRVIFSRYLLDMARALAQTAATQMRISDRYIGRQVLYGTLFAVVVLSLVLVLGNLFKQIRPLLVDKHAPVWLVFRFVLNVLPYSLMFTIPWGFLSAVLLVFGRLSADQEVTSFRVAGVSLWRLVLPVFVIAALLSGTCLWLNLRVVPKAKSSMIELLYDQARPPLATQPGRGPLAQGGEVLRRGPAGGFAGRAALVSDRGERPRGGAARSLSPCRALHRGGG